MIARKSTWQLQEAKNKLSEVIRRAREEGPQTITVRGEDAVVVMPAEEYERLVGKPAQRESFYEFATRWAPRMEGIDLVIPPRLIDPPRPVLFDDELPDEPDR
ncbi:MAG: type II toxin-antitoxin system Phd/YefM family antitoxin [bacterium]